MQDKITTRFYTFIIITAIIPYSNSILPFIPGSIAGFALSGWAWMTMLVVSIHTLVTQKKPAMPFAFWLPWGVYILGYNLFAFSLLGVQLSLQYLCFVVTGIAASTLYYSDTVLAALFKRFKLLLWGIFAFGIPYKLIFGYTPNAQQLVMTAIAASAFLLSLFFLYRKTKPLLLYFGLVVIPVLSVTRMPTIVILVIGALHFANKSIVQKAVFSALIVIAGLVVFQLPAFQQKMFHSGSGTIEDLFSPDDSNINTSGRDRLTAIMENGIAESPVFGNGPRTDLAAFMMEGLEIMEAHNDYLAVQYSYGYIGLLLLFLGLGGQFLHLYAIRKKLTDPLHIILCYTALTLFISWAMLMRTDNVMKYSVYFGNFHFCMIGMLYSLLKNNEYNSSHTTIQ